MEHFLFLPIFPIFASTIIYSEFQAFALEYKISIYSTSYHFLFLIYQLSVGVLNMEITYIALTGHSVLLSRIKVGPLLTLPVSISHLKVVPYLAYTEDNLI